MPKSPGALGLRDLQAGQANLGLEAESVERADLGSSAMGDCREALGFEERFQRRARVARTTEGIAEGLVRDRVVYR